MSPEMHTKLPVMVLLAAVLLSINALPARASPVPFLITGYVTVDGMSVNGVHVSCNGAAYTTCSDAGGNPGFYLLMPGDVTQGSQVTVSYEYEGRTVTATVEANGDSARAPTVDIVAAGQALMPSATAMPAPSAAPVSPATSTPAPIPALTTTPVPTPTGRPVAEAHATLASSPAKPATASPRAAAPVPGFDTIAALSGIFVAARARLSGGRIVRMGCFEGYGRG